VSTTPEPPARVDAVVGRTVADHMEESGAPDFELELRAQLDLVQTRLEGEQAHLAQVERVVTDYLPPRHLRLVR
jgi:hypothetical protein